MIITKYSDILPLFFMIYDGSFQLLPWKALNFQPNCETVI